MNGLIEVRWHGRGGQGIVTVSRLLAEAALTEGKYVQAFPEFGPERSGAPVLGFTRISEEPISLHSQIYEPNIVVVVDPVLLKPAITKGLVKNGVFLANSTETPKALKNRLPLEDFRVFTVNARRIALDVLGRPIYNTAMLGAFARVSPIVSLESIINSVKARFSGPMSEKNVEVVKRGFNEVNEE
ncbi:MAG: 2-oxoacid:acceptor oxidoreductase family protein [Candidatus Bathyarchaeia archaeon]